MPGDGDLSFEQQIGKILGFLEPIPDALRVLFQKVDEEVKARLTGDETLKSDIRSLREHFDRVVKELQALTDTRVLCAKEHQASFDLLSKTVKDLSDLLRDISRALSLKDGKASALEDLQKKVDEIDRVVKGFSKTEQTAWEVVKGFSSHVLSIIIAVVIAYLLFKLGIK